MAWFIIKACDTICRRSAISKQSVTHTSMQKCAQVIRLTHPCSFIKVGFNNCMAIAILCAFHHWKHHCASYLPPLEAWNVIVTFIIDYLHSYGVNLSSTIYALCGVNYVILNLLWLLWFHLSIILYRLIYHPWKCEMSLSHSLRLSSTLFIITLFAA